MNIIQRSDDGIWGVIRAADLPPDCARSKTRDDPDEAMAAPWDAAFTAPVGPNSTQKYVKVRLADLGLVRPRVTLSPGNYANPKAGKIIPAYPHTCPTCGGKMLMLFTSQEHEGGGPCPGAKPGPTSIRRKR